MKIIKASKTNKFEGFNCGNGIFLQLEIEVIDKNRLLIDVLLKRPQFYRIKSTNPSYLLESAMCVTEIDNGNPQIVKFETYGKPKRLQIAGKKLINENSS